MPTHLRPAAFLTTVLVLVLLAMASRGALAEAHGPEPGPALSPSEVVRIQLEALRNNGPDDHGIAVCFRFASPSNKASTGPLERFAQIIRQGPYGLMLEYRDAEFFPIEVRGDAAHQRVTLNDATRAVTYIFILSKQSEEPCAGCWMTDGVYIEKVERRVT